MVKNKSAKSHSTKKVEVTHVMVVNGNGKKKMVKLETR